MGGEITKGKDAKEQDLNTMSSCMNTPMMSSKPLQGKKGNVAPLNKLTRNNANPTGSIGSIPTTGDTPRNKEPLKRKKDKMVIIAKNVKISNEKKVLELIQKNNLDMNDYDMLYEIIDKHFFMQTLEVQARKEIIRSMSLCKVKKDATLFKQGSIGEYWYVVNQGSFGLSIDHEFKKELVRGDSFGEYALMHNAPRSATVKALEESMVWVLKQESFRKIIDLLFTMNYEENMKFLDTIPLPLDSTFKSILANNVFKQVYEEGMPIFKQNELAQCMYIIKEGTVVCTKNDKLIRTLNKGDHFGQKAILRENKRTLDVSAKTKCVLYSISIEFFKTHLGENYMDPLYLSFIQMSFQSTPALNKIHPKMIEKVYHLFSIKNYEDNEVIFHKGDMINDKLYIVLEGNIYNAVINKYEAKRHEFLMLDNILKQSKETLQHDLIAEPDCLLAIVDFKKFQEALGGSINDIVNKSSKLCSFQNVSIFKNLSDNKLESLEQKLQIEQFNNGKKIIVQGEIGDKFYIVKSGRVDFFVNSKYVRSLNENEEFGARSLIISERRSATAIANGEVTLFSLTADVFKSLLEPKLLQYFQHKFSLEDNTIELKDLDNIKELGHGSFGFVNLVRSRKTKQMYAIKALNLVQIEKEKLQPCVELEKNVLLKVDHPFIMKMVKYLKNNQFIFFITEYIKGKELWDVIRDIGFLNKYQTQFYGGSLMMAIDYLHSKKVIYRDIKPENIMVNDMGYIKVIDFGTVKEIKERTSTIIGTPHYMAPEIVRGEGYSFQVDVWSIAVCMFEFLCGKLPFGEDCEDPMDVYRAVANGEAVFPNFIKDEDFKSMMTKMMKKSPLTRLWKFNQIKQDPWFNDFDWNSLISFALPAAYKITFDKTNNLNNVRGTPYLTYLKAKAPMKTEKTDKTKKTDFDKWVQAF